MSPEPNFDTIARPYKLFEYLTLGPALQRCRTHYLERLLQQRCALVLGDGDGRFLAQLLSAHPELRADAVDTSGVMISLLEANCQAASPTAAARLRTHQTTAEAFLHALPPLRSYDLVVSHFFLDCLTQSDLETLVRALKPHLEPGALWLISDFRIPPKGPLRFAARALVRGLYLAFRILTGLRITRLPDHGMPLAAAGLNRIAQRCSLGGLLTTELWHKEAKTTHFHPAAKFTETSPLTHLPTTIAPI